MAAAAIVFLALVILGVFSGTSHAGVIDNGPAYDTVQIHNNTGGKLVEFDRDIEWYNKTGTHLEISGYCASACTFFMQVENACFAEDAMLLFHAPFYMTPYGHKVPLFNNPDTLVRYPRDIRNFILKSGGLTHQWVVTFAGQWADSIQICGKEPLNVS